MSHFLGLRTGKVTVPDLERAKRWYALAFGVEPYFDEPFYVGFNVGGFELGLDPDTSHASPGVGGTTTYWGVTNVAEAYAHLLAVGATPHEPPTEVGGGIVVATVLDPFGNPLGIIENPHFTGA